MVHGNRARDDKEKNQHNRPQKTDQEGNQCVEDSFLHSDELVARAELSMSINEISEE